MENRKLKKAIEILEICNTQLESPHINEAIKLISDVAEGDDISQIKEIVTDISIKVNRMNLPNPYDIPYPTPNDIPYPNIYPYVTSYNENNS